MSAEIKKVNNKNGTTSYRVSIYLGIDELTGKKRRTTRCFPTKRSGTSSRNRQIRVREKQTPNKPKNSL